MLVIDRGHAGVALDHTLVGGHLGRLVVGEVGHDRIALDAQSILGVLIQPLTQLLGLALQPLEFAAVALRFVQRLRIGLALRLDHAQGLLLHLAQLALEIGARAAAGLGSIGGQFDAVDGEHLTADEALAVAQHQHLGKELGDLVAEFGDEGGQCAVVGLALTADNHEHQVVAAGRFHLAAADDASAVG